MQKYNAGSKAHKSELKPTKVKIKPKTTTLTQQHKQKLQMSSGPHINKRRKEKTAELKTKGRQK